MYGTNNIQASNLISNVPTVIEIERKCKIETSVQLESAFQTYQNQKEFYKNITGMMNNKKYI